MSGITPPPFFIKPLRPERTAEAEQRFYESSDHDFAIGLGAAIAALSAFVRSAGAVVRRARGAPIDKWRIAAFKIGPRPMEPTPHDRTHARCRC